MVFFIIKTLLFKSIIASWIVYSLSNWQLKYIFFTTNEIFFHQQFKRMLALSQIILFNVIKL